MSMLDDTIAAVASGAGPAARGIVRLSGHNVRDCLRRCFEPVAHWPPPHDRTPSVLGGSLAVSLDGRSAALPGDLYYWPGNRSYTRQPSAELHLPGSGPLLSAALDAVCRAGARLAEAGEFTLRAFLAGRLDLTQAEAVLGVIDAADRRQLDAALAQLAGGLARPLAEIRQRLLDTLAHVEAGLDFVDEDIEFISPADLEAQLTDAAQQVGRLLSRMNARLGLPAVARVVLVGPPNAGKSSLFNALVGADHAALVSPVAGTTRDYLSAPLPLDGVDCELVDTAGLAASAPREQIDQAAQAAALDQQQHADVRLICMDVTRPHAAHPQHTQAGPGLACPLWTKIDLADAPAEPPGIAVSARTGAGLARLRAHLRELLQTSQRTTGEVVAHTASRCRDSLAAAAASLDRAVAALRDRCGEEVVAFELRTAVDEVGRVAGSVYTDDLLDRIFSRFCIGK